MGVDWVLVPCLVQLRREFDLIAPDRDRRSDGSIGDVLHSLSSDHTPDEISDALRGRDRDRTNEVHALDVDTDLKIPGEMEAAVQLILGRCRAGLEKRLRYIIYRRRIWSASDGWKQRPYTGANAHDQHAHFSATYETAHEASKASWHLEDLVAITPDDLEKIRTIVRDEVSKVPGLDGDPGDRKYSLGGLITSIERRTADDDDRANAVAVQLNRIEAAVTGKPVE